LGSEEEEQIGHQTEEEESFFSLIVYGGTKVLILLCRLSEDSLQRSTIPDGSPPKDWKSTVGWGRLLDSNPGRRKLLMSTFAKIITV
jgi:hypothetical protein